MPDSSAFKPPAEPDSRVALAAERTLLAWIRTGLAMMGFGFVVARFGVLIRELNTAPAPSGASPLLPGSPSGTPTLWIGTALVALGVVVQMLAAWEYLQMSRRFREGALQIAPVPSRLGVGVALLLAAIGVAMTVSLLTTFR